VEIDDLPRGDDREERRRGSRAEMREGKREPKEKW
jgi:hypothetical protein